MFDSRPHVDTPEVATPETREINNMSERLQAFGHMIAKKRDIAVNARRASGLEKRWLDDNDHYNGIDPLLKASSNLVDTTIQNALGGVRRSKHVENRSRVFVNITRPKTNTAEARLADMLLPSDDRNWGIKPVSAPHLINMMQDMNPMPHPQDPTQMMMQHTEDGPQPVTKADIAHKVMAEALKKANAMQDEIDAQLTECEYNGEVRKVLHDAAVLGSGVLKGPMIISKTKQAWIPVGQTEDGADVHAIEIKEDMTPASVRVDPWNFFPDPSCGEDIHNGEFVFERKYITARGLRKLARAPGYLVDQIREVLREEPKRSTIYDEHDVRNRDQSGFTAHDTRYEMWEYHGDIDKDDLMAAGVKLPEELRNDTLRSYEGVVIVVNDRAIKAGLHPIETGGFQYDVFVWERHEGHWTGFGIPYLMRTQQRVMNAAWRQLMDNTSLSVGPQIVLNRGLIDPADGSWELSGRKIWLAKDELADIRAAFATHNIESHIEEIQKIIEMCQKFIDEESMVPQIAQGEKDGTPDTLGGMTILMNSANIVLRRLVKQFDDRITRPHLRRYYDWNMQENPKAEIKGDFEIDARGSSALVVRDTQNQAFIEALALAGNPAFGHMIKTAELLRKALSARSIDPDDIVKDDQEIQRIEQRMQQNAGQNGNPDAHIRAQAQIQSAQIKAETDQKRIALQEQSNQQDAQLRAHQHQVDRDYQMQLKLLDREIQQSRLQIEQAMKLQDAKVKLATAAMSEKNKREMHMHDKMHDAGMKAMDRANPEPVRQLPNGASA